MLSPAETSRRPPQDQRDKEEGRVFPKPSEGRMGPVEATGMERYSHSRKNEPEQRAAGKKYPNFSPPILRCLLEPPLAKHQNLASVGQGSVPLTQSRGQGRGGGVDSAGWGPANPPTKWLGVQEQEW